MAKLIRSMPEDEPIGTWKMTEALLGPRAYEVSVKSARHLTERLITSAERNGFIRRLPVRSVSRSPQNSRPWLPENQYVATMEGRMFVLRHDMYFRLSGVVRKPRPSRRSASFEKNDHYRLTRYKNKAPSLGEGANQY